MRLILAVLLLLALPALAAEETKPLAEVHALRIRVLMLERQVIKAQAGRVQAEATLQYQEKAKALDAAVEAAAKESDVDLKEGWQPDVEKKVWRKGK